MIARTATCPGCGAPAMERWAEVPVLAGPRAWDWVLVIHERPDTGALCPTGWALP